MGHSRLKDIIISPIKRISNLKGDILHGLKKSDKSFVGFGEAYFTHVNLNQIKGWNKHKRMTLNLIVPIGIVKFIAYDERKEEFLSIKISKENYQRITIPPGLWFAFKGISQENLILNIADIEHEPDEIVRKDIENIPYNW